ncbi:hypothetical protein Bca101_035408 [Brassica carinata]
MRSPKLLLNDKEEEEVSGDELEPLADDFLDGRDEEEGTLGSDSDSDLEKERFKVRRSEFVEQLKADFGSYYGWLKRTKPAICLSNHITRKASTIRMGIRRSTRQDQNAKVISLFSQQHIGKPVAQELLDRLCKLIAILAGGATAKSEALREKVLATGFLEYNPLAELTLTNSYPLTFGSLWCKLLEIRGPFPPDELMELIEVFDKQRPMSIRYLDCFTTIDNLVLINVEGTGMAGVPGTASDIFGAIKDVGANASNEHSVCFAVPEKEVNAVSKALRSRFSEALQAGSRSQANINVREWLFGVQRYCSHQT